MQDRPFWTVRYRNHRGDISTRRIVPMSIDWRATDWHPTPQYILSAYDLDKMDDREFALADFLPAEGRMAILDSVREAIAQSERHHRAGRSNITANGLSIALSFIDDARAEIGDD